MKVNRKALLLALQAVSPGLSPKDKIEQSSCFVFANGEVITFNDDVACRTISGLPKDLAGAVRAEEMLELLEKRQDEDLEISFTENMLLIKGPYGKSGLVMEAEIQLPIESLEKPEDWKALDESFPDAVGMVASCAGIDESEFHLTCVHLHPKWAEACDGWQMCRWRLDTGVSSSTVVPAKCIKPIANLGMTHLSESEGWLHFKNANGLVYSCRRYLEEYPSLGKVLKVEGTLTTLPKRLAEAADRANIFSKKGEDNKVLIRLRSGKLTLRGEGINGFHQETKKINYEGPELSFFISPVILAELVKKHNECTIAPNKLLVDGGNYVYVSCLSQPEESEPKPAEVEA